MSETAYGILKIKVNEKEKKEFISKGKGEMFFFLLKTALTSVQDPKETVKTIPAHR
jgi:hypothetical protein